MTAGVCPDEVMPAVLECPRGCGLVVWADPDLRWGPWRMQVHLSLPKCPTPRQGYPTSLMTPAALRACRIQQRQLTGAR